jgi:hypothetical protein
MSLGGFWTRDKTYEQQISALKFKSSRAAVAVRTRDGAVARPLRFSPQKLTIDSYDRVNCRYLKKSHHAIAMLEKFYFLPRRGNLKRVTARMTEAESTARF